MNEGYDQFLKDLQDPTTKDGFWNLFAALWGTAQSQPGFDYKAWLALRAYVKKLETEIDEHRTKQSAGLHTAPHDCAAGGLRVSDPSVLDQP